MLKGISLCFLLIFSHLSADLYKKILEDSLPYGSYQKKEIEIITDPDKRGKIEQIQKKRLVKKGFSLSQAMSFSQTGIVAEDHYWIWVRDAVLFPTGHIGTYDRLLLKNSDNLTPGAAALAMTEEGKIAVIICFRHATRSWEVELPRGSRNKEESFEQTAVRELKEETGIIVKKTHFLGNMTPDSGLLSSIIPIFFMEIDYEDTFLIEPSEAIYQTVLIQKDELFEAFKKGYLDFEGKKIPLRDSFLAFALLQAKLKGFL